MNKQIEEMAKVMHDRAHEIAEGPYGLAKILAQGKNMADDFAEVLYKEGYRKASDVAREIFEEIEILLDTYSASHHFIGEICGESYFERGLEDAIAELKKKYESEGADGE